MRGIVGLDVGSDAVSVCVLAAEDGRELGRRAEIANSEAGARQLTERLVTLARQEGITAYRIGIEASSLYWWPLALGPRPMMACRTNRAPPASATVAVIDTTAPPSVPAKSSDCARAPASRFWQAYRFRGNRAPPSPAPVTATPGRDHEVVERSLWRSTAPK